MLPRRAVRFRLNGAMVSVAPDVPAAETLLRWLRATGLAGTKEGCAEGDCGACTVALEQPDGPRTPINACLVALGQLDGASIVTVEGLRGAHPVQHAMAAGGATQCGFCTPGFVMAAWAYQQEGGDVHEALAGNLCRCTGYRPIVDALIALPDADAPPPPMSRPGAATFEGAGHSFHRPATMPQLLELRAAAPDAWLLAGGTDLGLHLSEGRDRPRAIVCLLGVPELQRLEIAPDGLSIGAAVSYARILDAVSGIDAFAPLVPLLARLGSRQIRGLGTLGGNLGTASPIGDMLPPLLALDATVHLRATAGAREMKAADFLRGYRLNALAPDEVIQRVWLPAPAPGATFVCEKISKRYDQDISTVSAAFLLRIESDIVVDLRLAFGGMGPAAARAHRAEAAMLGRPWSQAAIERAATALADDFAPLSDLRSTAGYRAAAAAGLLRRLWWRIEAPELALDVQAL